VSRVFTLSVMRDNAAAGFLRARRLSTEDFGWLPQKRNRLIIIAWENGSENLENIFRL